MEFGIQLSSLKPLLDTYDHVSDCCRKLYDMGYRYTQIQWVSGNLEAEKISEIVKDSGLISIGIQEKYDELSAHFDYFSALNRHAAIKDLCFSTIPERFMSEKGLEAFINLMKAHAKRAQESGMTVSFHPTKGDFRRIGNQYACGILFDRLPEIGIVPDTCQLLRAGVDVEAFVQKYASRIRIVHFKDMTDLSDSGELTSVGSGITDFASIFGLLKNSACSYVLAEQETWKTDPFEEMKKSLYYLKTLS